jgi:hypothetical protein
VPQHGHRAQCDRGSATPIGGTDDEVRGGGRFELVESKGEAADMEEGAEAHRGGTTLVGGISSMAAAVEGTCSIGGVRGKTIWPENCSKARLTE